MPRVHPQSATRSYLADNEGLVPDVLAAIQILEIAKSPLGEPFRFKRSGEPLLYLLETMYHWVIYKWRVEGVSIEIVYPIKPTMEEFINRLFE